jgi:transposase InsO family protein
VDHRSEFLNVELEEWCQEHGIEIQCMAPYSSSQNGIAEHMNHKLVELAHVMLIMKEVSEFL